MPRQRDWVARSPLMRKGGAHVKSKTAQRTRSRLKLEDELHEWYEADVPNENSDEMKKEKTTGSQWLPVVFLLMS
ncbi:MAG: hypothetical protein COB30_001595 [Ectothiorhodospiraceae bacterium]|nr:hypothetical protein [Ectothiorhodospiraceae bacterium]